ncbi:MAG: small multi-drug export protein [Candidatus Krumholzibacteriia bacterium]|nr:small multi-drug export protein [bacterium]
MHALLDWIRSLPAGPSVLLMAMLPIVELRGAIPFGVSVHGLGYAQVYLLAVLGNLVPILPILLLLGPLERTVGRWGPARRFLDWVFARSRRKGAMIERVEFWGLVLFVGIPLPVTGAWTGAAAAYVFGLPLRRSLPAIVLGVCLAGLVVSLAWAAGIGVFTKLPL